MEGKIRNPHDKFFKSLMKDRSIAIAFLEEFLPDSVKSVVILDQMQPISETFISEELEEYMADMVFKVPLLGSVQGKESCYVSILLEHKSFVDPHVDFQILYYLAHSYRQQIKSGSQLHLVIPFLYYHGKKKWEPTPISDFFKHLPDHFLEYLPFFSKIFIDLNELSQNQIKTLRNQFVRSALTLQKLAANPDQVLESVFKILHTMDSVPERNFVKLLLVYSFSIIRISKESLQDKIKLMAPQIKSEILSTYDQIKLEGRLEGKLEGKLETKTEIVLNLFDAGMDINFISKMTGLTEEEVLVILKENGR